MTAKNLLKKIRVLLLSLCVINIAVSAAIAKNEESLTSLLTGIIPLGWELAQPIKQFSPKNLWEQINGRAEFYLAYDMVQMTYVVFEDASNPEIFIDMSIYNMGRVTHAFGVFSAERHQDTTPVRMGREGYKAGGSLYIWKGPYYIRMIASDSNPKLQKINQDLAEKITDSLQDSGETLWGLGSLPETDRVPGSERYFLRDAMGLDFMNDTYTARYRKNDDLITLFLSKKESPATAVSVLKRYAGYANRFGEGFKEVTRNGVTITLCDMDGSYDALFLKGDVVAGVTAVAKPEVAAASAFELWRYLEIPQ